MPASFMRPATALAGSSWNLGRPPPELQGGPAAREELGRRPAAAVYVVFSWLVLRGPRGSRCEKGISFIL